MPGETSVDEGIADNPRIAARSIAAGHSSADATIPDDPHTRRLLAALEVDNDGATRCPCCGGTSLCRWGTSRRQFQRRRCHGCGRSFTAATGTALAHIQSLDKLRAVAVDMLSRAPRSCRKLATALGIDRMTVWRWRRLIAGIWAPLQPAAISGPAEADTTILRESRKASREWVDHYRESARHPAPDRLRWIDYRQLDLPLPEPMTRYLVPVQLTTTGTPPVASPPCPATGDGRAAVARSVPDHARTGAPGADVASDRHQRACVVAGYGAAGAAATDETFGISLGRAFRHFLAPFRGPATRHLQTYTAWFGARVHPAIRPPETAV
jgi:transposase-like protein